MSENDLKVKCIDMVIKCLDITRELWYGNDELISNTYKYISRIMYPVQDLRDTTLDIIWDIYVDFSSIYHPSNYLIESDKIDDYNYKCKVLEEYYNKSADILRPRN